MDKELLDRLENIEKKLSNKKKGFWENITVFTPIMIPLAIAFVGWYFTNQHNENQLKLQEKNSENQRQVAFINSSVGQSSLIKDFIPHLNSKDTTEQDIAIVAILYAAPSPGKKIVDILAISENPNVSSKAKKALDNKKRDLLNNLFSIQKQNRIIAANELISNWTDDSTIINELITKAENCINSSKTDNEKRGIDCNNGIYNAIIVLQNFPPEQLNIYKPEFRKLKEHLPKAKANAKTRKLANELLKKIL